VLAWLSAECFCVHCVCLCGGVVGRRDQSYIAAVAPSRHSAAGSTSSPIMTSPLHPVSSTSASSPHRVLADDTVPRCDTTHSSLYDAVHTADSAVCPSVCLSICLSVLDYHLLETLRAGCSQSSLTTQLYVALLNITDPILNMELHLS